MYLGRVYPGNDRKNWYTVHLHKTKEEFCKKVMQKPDVNDTMALCRLEWQGSRSGCRGAMYFCDEAFDDSLCEMADTIAHECGHVMFHYVYMTYRGWNLRKKPDFALWKKWGDRDPMRIPEEYACYALGHLVGQVTSKLITGLKDKT